MLDNSKLRSLHHCGGKSGTCLVSARTRAPSYLGAKCEVAQTKFLTFLWSLCRTWISLGEKEEILLFERNLKLANLILNVLDNAVLWSRGRPRTY